MPLQRFCLGFHSGIQHSERPIPHSCHDVAVRHHAKRSDRGHVAIRLELPYFVAGCNVPDAHSPVAGCRHDLSIGQETQRRHRSRVPLQFEYFPAGRNVPHANSPIV